MIKPGVKFKDSGRDYSIQLANEGVRFADGMNWLLEGDGKGP